MSASHQVKKSISIVAVPALIFIAGLLWGSAQTVSLINSKQSSKLSRVTFFNHFPVNTEFVMVGDSLTQQGIWNEMFPDVTIANRGVNGNTTSNVLNRIETIVATKAKTALILLGINDLHQNISQEETLANYKAIVEQLQEAGMEVVIQSTLECAFIRCGAELKQVRALNIELEKYANANNIKFIDINKNMTTPKGGLKKNLTNDGIHLSGEGYYHWSKAIAPIFDPAPE